MELSTEEFFHSLRKISSIKQVNTYGLVEASMSIPSKPDNYISDFLLFNQFGVCILHYKYQLAFPEKQYQKILIAIKNIAVFVIRQSGESEEFCFNKIIVGNLKVYFLIKNKMAFVGVFQLSCDCSFAKLILVHMFIALLNFKGDTIEKVSCLNDEEDEKTQRQKFLTIQGVLSNNRSDLDDFKTTDLFEFLIYEMFFLKYIGVHFKKIFDNLFEPEEMYLSYFKFKNMYIVEIPTFKILLDWLKIKKSKKNIKYYNNEKLWVELMHHSRSMMESYKNLHRNFYTNSDSSFRFVKFECTSTFPRITFIIKFVPLLRGISVIHVYSQKKLSRLNDNLDQQATKGYKEIDLLYGSEIKTNTNLFFGYSEPKLLQQIQKFLTEFLISIRKIDVFRDPNMKRELKYFNYSIITAINSVPSDNGKSTIENLINKINQKLHEMYNQISSGNDRQKSYERTISVNSNKIQSDLDKFETTLVIKKEDILNDMFNVNNKNGSNSKDNKKKEAEGENGKSTLINILSDHSSENSLSLSRIEPPANNSVTIDQSRDVSAISPKPVRKKSRVIDYTDIQLDQLLDMTTTSHVFRKDGKKKSTQVSPGKGNKFNIKVPNPKETKDTKKETTKGQQKLILLDEKEMGYSGSQRELINSDFKDTLNHYKQT